MAKLLVYYAHPGHRYSHANRAMVQKAREVEGISFVDLYSDYPRHEIDIDREQSRLLAHDVILFQFPVFWYSAPSLVKEWEDLVLEHGFAYGGGGDKLAGKRLMLAITAAGPADAYTADGYQGFPIRTFLTPFEQTARLCHMHFSAPYVLFGALEATATGGIEAHAEGYLRMLEAVRDDRYDYERAAGMEVIGYDSLPISPESQTSLAEGART